MPTEMDDLEEIIIPVRLNTNALQRDMRQMQQLSQRFASSMSATFADAIVSGRKFSDVLRGLAQQLLRISINAALKPAIGGLTNAIGSAFGGLLGGMTATPFARGGVVGVPALFAHSGGLGLMGEAGPEAIMPLARGPDGRLGVRASGGAPVTITMNITTPDAESFRRSRGRITAELARAVSEGQRNL